jgi:NAD(P)-dependent dehydrogenase (short-subunit alcohol dehydrogenase family)
VISGTCAAINDAIERLARDGVAAKRIPVACAFHSPLMADAQKAFAGVLSSLTLAPPEIPVFSNTSAARHSEDPEALRRQLIEHLCHPVRFVEEIRAMYAAGARTFLEVGPRNVLSNLVSQILGENPHSSMALDAADGQGIANLLHVLGRLAIEGRPVSPDRLFEGRVGRTLDLSTLESDTRASPLKPTTWLVSGGRARPAKEEKPAAEDAAVVLSEVSAKGQPAATANAPRPPSHDREAATAPAGLPAGADDVMVRFQEMMSQFLETQQEVMLNYLAGQGAAGGKFTSSIDPTNRDAEAVVSRASKVTNELAPEEVSRPPVQHSSLHDRLLKIITDRTGYPPEMLGPDLNLEADLGIDSIKRIEILGAFQLTCTANEQERLRGAMEKLSGLRTIGSLVTSMSAMLSETGTEAVTAVVDPPSPPDAELLPRFVLEVGDAPANAAEPLPPLAGVVLVTDDGRGVAAALADALRATGQAVEVVGSAGPAADLSDYEQVQHMVGGLRERHGRIAGLVHLLPLDAAPDPAQSIIDSGACLGQLARDTKGLFHLAKATARDLQGGFLLATTCLGGAFATTPEPNAFACPTHGAVAGLIKTLSAEWPSVRCRVVDFHPDECPSNSADHLMSELLTGLGSARDVEIGYDRGRRIRPIVTPAPLSAEGPTSEIALDNESVVLVTGGARGITAKSVIALAERFRPRLVIVGRSPLPAEEECPATATFTSARELRAALVEQMRRGTSPPAAAEVEAACTRLLREREIRANLRLLRSAGSDVSYISCDLADASAVARLVDDTYARFGRIDGVVHGAGVIEDKLVVDKDPASFDRVLGAKVTAALVFAEKLRSQSLKFFALFSSVSGRFGNRGQADYAAANELLNKLAAFLDSRWPARVVAINWGPWDGSNMVGESVRQQFQSRGVQLITAQSGARSFIAELLRGRKGEPEVILGGGPWRSELESPTREGEPVKTQQASASGSSSPLLAQASCSADAGASFQALVTLDPLRHLYLEDHRLDGNPVLPMAAAVELMAQVAARAWPDRLVTGAGAVRLYRGVVLNGGLKVVRVSARPASHHDQERIEQSVDVEITDPQRPSVAHYRATIYLADCLPPARTSAPPAARGKPRALEADVYAERLFHGPRFHGLTRIDAIDENGVVADVRGSIPANWLADAAVGDAWIIDPLLLDLGPQLAILWAQEMRGMTALPSRIGRVRVFEGPSAIRSGPLTCVFKVKTSGATEGDHELIADVDFINPQDGRIVLSVERLECTCSKALNRLAGAATVEAGAGSSR